MNSLIANLCNLGIILSLAFGVIIFLRYVSRSSSLEIFWNRRVLIVFLVVLNILPFIPPYNANPVWLTMLSTVVTASLMLGMCWLTDLIATKNRWDDQ
jgi:hypothetical protein